LIKIKLYVYYKLIIGLFKVLLKKFLFSLSILSLPILLTACGNETTRVSRMLLGTEVRITIADSRENVAELFEIGFREVEKIQKSFNPNNAESEIFKINDNAVSRPFRCSEEVYSLIKRSIEISEITGGAFDITWASAGKIWNFSEDDFSPPDDKIIKSLLPLISYKNIVLDDKRKTIRILADGTKIGLGGVAKGYAVEKTVSELRKTGIRGAIVACAGDIQVIGSNYGRSWKGGIKDPRGNSVIATFFMKDGESVSTSGDYERFRIVNGRRFHHIINPSTGYPADSGLISVTVFSNEPVLSDAYSTAFFVAGLDKTKNMLSSMEGISAVLVDADMKVYASALLENRLKFRDDLRVVFF